MEKIWFIKYTNVLFYIPYIWFQWVLCYEEHSYKCQISNSKSNFYQAYISEYHTCKSTLNNFVSIGEIIVKENVNPVIYVPVKFYRIAIWDDLGNNYTHTLNHSKRHLNIN